MVRRALLTTLATVIFVAHGNRRGESETGLAALDIALPEQTYLGLPDGQLWQHQAEIAEQITAMALAQDVTRILTLGSNGYDEHPDHITTHLAAEVAVSRLRSRHGRDLGILALNANHNGNHTAAATDMLRRRKLSAIALHRSQFPISPVGVGTNSTDQIRLDEFAIEPRFWDGFAPYHPLILQGETYDKV